MLSLKSSGKESPKHCDFYLSELEDEPPRGGGIVKLSSADTPGTRLF